jgi:hypothetical protein
LTCVHELIICRNGFLDGIIFLPYNAKLYYMRDWLRTLIAGYGAYKWGGGCVGTILVFIIIYWLLGHC